MSNRETDFDFDFFEEPETQESSARARPRGGPRRPVRPPPGLTPLLRLVGLIAFAIAVVVVLVLVVQSCRSSDKKDTYASYMQEMRGVGNDSQTVGRQLNALLTTPGIRLPTVQSKLDGLVQQQEQDVTRATAVTPPGRLRDQHDQALQSLEFRVSGLRGLQRTFAEGRRIKRSATAGRLLAAQVRRFVASDVIWSDSFKAGSTDVLANQDVTGVPVPGSTFVRDPDLANSRVLAQFWQRISGATTGKRGPGPHGNALVSTEVLPGGQALSSSQENVVVASADLRLQVTIENSGNSQEVHVRVRLSVPQQARPFSRTMVVDVINPGQQKTVTFGELDAIQSLTKSVQVHVEVLPVQGEANVKNNAATYPITFRISG